MAYQEPDIHNFSTSSSHRLPTVSGTQALLNELARAKGISTGLSTLDQALVNNAVAISNAGIQRGHVTEIYGPPGAGKTTLGMQVAVNALRSLDSASKVVWISTGAPLVQSRLQRLFAGHDQDIEPRSSPPQPEARVTQLADNFLPLEIQSLPRVLTLLMHPTASYPPPATSVIVIDDLSNLISGSFPRSYRQKTSGSVSVADRVAQRANSRRFQVVESLAGALSRLAAARHLAIVVLTNATISVKSGQRALLKPALSGQTWDIAIHTRIVLYQDFRHVKQRDPKSARGRKTCRLAAVVRLANRDVYREAVSFTIGDAGLQQSDASTAEPGLHAISDGQTNLTTPHVPVPERPLSPIPSSPPSGTFQRASQITDPLTQRSAKRKATEIVDSEAEDESDDGIVTRHTTVAASGVSAALNASIEPFRDEEEMLLDTHGTSLVDSRYTP